MGGLSSGSIDIVLRYLRQISKHRARPAPEDIKTLKDRWLIEGKAPSTINKMLFATRWFFKYRGEDVAFRRAKERYGIIEYLTPEQVSALFAAIDQEPNEFIRLRDKAIFALIIYCSTRRTELTRLKRKDVDLINRVIKLWKPKNRYPKTANIPNEAFEISAPWINFVDKHGYPDDGPLFLTTCGNPIKTKTLKDIVKKYRRKCGFHFNITILRHTCGTHMKLNGADSLDIKEHMRHRSIASTMRYVAVEKKIMLRKTVNKCLSFNGSAKTEVKA
jgi:integrase